VSNELERPAAPWTIQLGFRTASENMPGLPAGFRFQDLRHYYASLLIASGLVVNVVQARLRHASAKTKLDLYRHHWPDSDESAHNAVASVIRGREEFLADFLRTKA
jgi:integrase